MQNLVELVQTWVANPVLGDMLYETRYVNYQDYAGVKFPGVIHAHQGDPWVNLGHNTLDIRVNAVEVNPALPADDGSRCGSSGDRAFSTRRLAAIGGRRVADRRRNA